MKPIDLDALDWRLLTLLQADANRSNLALAQAAHVSPATAMRRIKRLYELGAVARCTALAGQALLAQGLTAISEVTLDRQGAEHLAAFEARAVAEDAVQQCWRVSPGPDFVLVSWVRNMPAHAALVQRLFTQDANVRNVKTFFAVARAKFGAEVPPP